MNNATILIVDDEEANILLLERMLAKAGYTKITSTVDSRQALPLFDAITPDLVLLDLNMPAPNGFEILEGIKQRIPADSYLPILVLTGDSDPIAKQKALAGGAKDFLIKPFNLTEVLLRIGNLVETRELHKQLQAHKLLLEQKVQEALGELRQAQTKAIEQERMNALGLMARGVAHDFNNTLAVILGFGELVLNDLKCLPNMEGAVKSMEIIVTAATDGAKIVDRLREFHRSSKEENVSLPVDLNPLVRQAAAFTEPRWKNEALAKGVVVKFKLDLRDIPPILGDPAELREVLANLIFNALDAMPQGGTLLIKTRLEQGQVVLSVSDTGTGMSEEVRKRCLEPFFTTKGKRGTGLGLAMVYGIIHRHNGTLEVQSELGRGTTFTLGFPPKESLASTPLAFPEKLIRPLRILIADGNPVLCDLASQYLGLDGHTIERATSGLEAFEKFKADSFDLVITGKVLPGMNGDQLAHAIKELAPEMPVVMLTGFGIEEEKERPPGIDLILGKPISRNALRRALVEVLGQEKPSLP
jgi:signal transduction histidine kinase